MIDSAGEHDVIAGQSEVKRSRLHRSSVIGFNRKFPRTDVLELVIWDETNQYGTFLPKLRLTSNHITMQQWMPQQETDEASQVNLISVIY
jgi:hypothetical protein